MSPGSTPATSGGLPPLPIPGPDPLPWPEASPGLGVPRAVGIAIAAGLILALLVRFGGRWVREFRARSALPAMPPPTASAADLVAVARAILVAVMGEPWGARTTEEIAASATALHPVFGVERTDRLIAFLQTADQARFAGHSEAEDAWRPLVAEILDTARSIKTGR